MVHGPYDTVPEVGWLSPEQLRPRIYAEASFNKWSSRRIVVVVVTTTGYLH